MDGIAATPPPGAESDSAASALGLDKSPLSPDSNTSGKETQRLADAESLSVHSDSDARSAAKRLEFSLVDPFTEEGINNILDRFLWADGTYKFIYFINGKSEGEPETPAPAEAEAIRVDEADADGEGQTGGAGDEELYDRIKTAHFQKIDVLPGYKSVLLGTRNDDVANIIQEVLALKDGWALCGLKRDDWEKPDPTVQCSIAKITRTPCWLCGNPVNIGQGGIELAGKRMSVCSPSDNQYECEHVLPGVFMLFLKRMINNTLRDPGRDAAIAARLYDSSCKICNGTKSDGVYIKARWVEGGAAASAAAAAAAAEKRLEFSPHNEKIMVDVLTFIVATRVGQEVEISRTEDPIAAATIDAEAVAAGQAAAATKDIPAEKRKANVAAREAVRKRYKDMADGRLGAAIERDKDTKPICSNRQAVVSYTTSSSKGVEIVSRSTFTSITTVTYSKTDPAAKEFTDKISGVLGPTFSPEAALSAEQAAAYNHNDAKLYNNLTRAVIEQDLGPAPPSPVDPVAHINIADFDYLVTDKKKGDFFEKTFFSSVFDVPDPAASALPAAAAAPAIPLAPAGPPERVEQVKVEKQYEENLRRAGVELKVDRNKARKWILNTYLAIRGRMAILCDLLNDPKNNPDIVAQTHRLATEPLLTADDIDALDAWSKVKVPAGAPAASEVGTKRRRKGGFRFTIHRRSETRQTKKNRRRKVIEVNV